MIDKRYVQKIISHAVNKIILFAVLKVMVHVVYVNCPKRESGENPE